MMRAIDQVAIVGAGTMGSALAQKFAQEGLQVVLVDRETRFLERGLDQIKGTLQEGVSRGIFTAEKRAEIVARIVPTTHIHDVVRCQLVIEAVFEDRAVKEELFGQLSSIVPVDTILATNTSSFSVSDLARSVSHPERFLGLHFFYHAAKNRLVEVVRGKATTEGVFEEALWLVRRCGKDPIVCRDAHGFVVNRFFAPWLNEAVRIYAQGWAGRGAIDAVACQRFGCGMGPFALMNATGVAIARHTQETLYQAFGTFYRPAEALCRQAERNEPWTINPQEAVDPAVAGRIAQRLLGVVFLVCAQLLDEGVCTAGDMNRGARIGLRWQKGPVELFHQYGEQQVGHLVKKVTVAWGLDTPCALTKEAWQMEFVTTSRAGKSAILTLNRPEDLNALDPTVVSQLGRAFDRANSDGANKTIIITGQGKAFVAGADVKFFIDQMHRGTIAQIVDFTRFTQALLQRIADSPKNIVALVNGLALGGGLEVALAADLIVALDTARLAFPETGLGIYPGLGGTQRTVSRIGTGLAKYLIYSGQMLTAREAFEIGLIDRVIGWDELREILNGAVPLPQRPGKRPDKWDQIEAFFDRFTITQLLGEEPSPDPEISSPRWSTLLQRIRSKAPRALRLAEMLINEQKGPAAEIAHLEEIFTTEDALAGLQSVGGRPPQFVER